MMNATIDRRNCQGRATADRTALAISLAALFSMAACHADGAPSNAGAEATHSKVAALLDKTRKNLRFVQGGSFQMGDIGPVDSPEKLPYTSQQDNKVLHKVTLDSFSIGAFKASYVDLDVFSEATGRPKVGTDKSTMRFRYPDAAAGVNWQQAHDYCQWLGSLLKLPMDLPTEAQWEYAARNRGQMVSFATDNGKVEPGRNVWEYQQRLDYIEKNNLNGYSPSLPLGQFPATPLGLHDMMTDGFEWMRDWYDADYYARSPQSNPVGPASGTERVLRSFASRDGAGLSFGDGMTFTRNHRLPDPPKVDYKGTPRPDRNMTADTAARCVVNSPAELH